MVRRSTFGRVQRSCAVLLLLTAGLSAAQASQGQPPQLQDAKQRVTLTEAKAYVAGLRVGASLWTDGQGTFPCSDQRLADFVIVAPQVPPKTCQVRIEEGDRFTIAAEFQGGLALVGTADEIRQVLPAELPKLSLK